MEPLTLLFTILSIIILLGYTFTKWSYTYWKRQGIDYIEPEFPFGNIREQAKGELSFGDQLTKFYNYFKAKGLKGGGVYWFVRPIYVVADLELIKNILQKDFSYFVNRGMYVNERDDPLSAHLFNLEDEPWKNMRTKLTPTFTSGKMKMMFQTFVACTTGLNDILTEHARIHDPVDIKDVVSRFTTDIIGSCAFGIDCNSLKNPKSEFRQFADKIFEPTFSRQLLNWIFFAVPRHILIAVGAKQLGGDIAKFFMNVVTNNVEYREKNNIQRKDFMQLLLQLKNQGKVSENDENLNATNTGHQTSEAMTMNQLAAQCFVFFMAGFETSATTMTFALLELAQNQEIQDRLRDEIEIVLEKHEGKISYESVMEMSYLDKVVLETLRKHPALPGTPRVCKKDYKIPGTDIVLVVGTKVHIPIQAVQRDPEYYPDPERFDPERFNEENRAKRPAFSFMAFGEGPRICIGARFGMLQAKVGILNVIKDFKVSLNQKTKTPIKYASKIFLSSVDGKVWLNVKPVGAEK